jgi:hypothetical protein
MTIGDQPMVNDLSYRPWEVSAAGIAALKKELSSNSEQIAPASPIIKVQLVDSKVQLVEKPKPRAKAQTPSQSETLSSPREVAAKEWLMRETQRLKQLGKIPVGIGAKTKLAKLLAANMVKAARSDTSISIKPVHYRHILNHMSKWGLWPITDIK